MENSNLYDPVCLIYPGTYRPIIKEEDVQTALKSAYEGTADIPPVNVINLAAAFKIEVAIPGVKREHFLLQSDANVLSIFVMKTGVKEEPSEDFHLHEFNYECFRRKVPLPSNADFEMATAEYHDGILKLLIPKSVINTSTKQSVIPVY